MENDTDNKLKNIKSDWLKTSIIVLAVLLVLTIGAVGIVLLKQAFSEDNPVVSTETNTEAESESTEIQDTADTTENTELLPESNKDPDKKPSQTYRPTQGYQHENGDAVTLHKFKKDDNIKFEVSEMLPGDTVVRYYGIRVSHKADVGLCFTPRVVAENVDISDIYTIKITNVDTNNVFCDGAISFADGNKFIDTLKYNNKGESTAYYKVEIHMPESAGNKYTNAMINLEFHWYVEDISVLTAPKNPIHAIIGSLGLSIPQTGDSSNLMLWVILAVSSLLLLLLIKGKLPKSLTLIVLLIISQSIALNAALNSAVKVDQNILYTGNVDINLNDGLPVITAEDFLFSPGTTVKKDFFIENEGSCDVYYKIYFKDVKGNLADVMEVTIQKGEKILYTGSPASLTRGNVDAADDILKCEEKEDFQISFHYPENIRDLDGSAYLEFVLSADAVQVDNNDDKEFK